MSDTPDTTTPAVPSPEDLATTTRVVTIEPSAITVHVEMSKSTQYAAEKKAVSTFLKASIPVGIDVFQVDEDGVFSLTSAFVGATDGAIQQMMNLCEVAAARQHGLEYQSDDSGVVRVINLFPGAKGAPAPTVAPGAFTAPAPVAPAPAPAAAPVAPSPAPPAAPAAPVGQPFPAAPAGPTPGAAPTPAPADGSQYKSDNPQAWSNQSEAQQKAIMATLEAWVQGLAVPEGTNIENKMVVGEKYPNVTVNGTKVSVKLLLRGNTTPARVKVWAEDCVNAGVVVPD